MASAPSAFALGLGVGAILILSGEKTDHHVAAAPKPAPVRTVIVHSVRTVHVVTTHVVHAGMPGWGMAVVAVVALGIVCSLLWRQALHHESQQ